MDAVIVFAHGSRDPLWRLPAEQVAQTIQQLAPATLARCAYLELCEPDLPSCAADLVSQGVHRIRILPAFLGVGRHAREDLPQLLEALQSSHPDVTFELLPTVGEDPRVIMLLAELALGKTT